MGFFAFLFRGKTQLLKRGHTYFPIEASHGRVLYSYTIVYSTSELHSWEKGKYVFHSRPLSEEDCLPLPLSIFLHLFVMLLYDGCRPQFVFDPFLLLLLLTVFVTRFCFGRFWEVIDSAGDLCVVAAVGRDFEF